MHRAPVTSEKPDSQRDQSVIEPIDFYGVSPETQTHLKKRKHTPDASISPTKRRRHNSKKGQSTGLQAPRSSPTTIGAESASGTLHTQKQSHRRIRKSTQRPTPPATSSPSIGQDQGKSPDLPSPSSLIKRIQSAKFVENTRLPPANVASRIDETRSNMRSLSRRHKSVPANLHQCEKDSEEGNAGVNSQCISVARDRMTRVQVPLTSFPKEIVEQVSNSVVDKTFERMEEAFERVNTTMASVAALHKPAIQPIPSALAPEQANNPSTPPPQPRNDMHATANNSRRSTKTLGERLLSQPKLPADVPRDDRKSDAELIAIGRFVNPYERHRRAPYAFSYRGTLRRKDYKYLLGRGEWTEHEISRITK